jgi:acyl-CoA dehydrogenase
MGSSKRSRGINAGRIRHGTRSLGVIKRCLELGKAYAKQRKTFGAPLADRQSVQWPLMLIVFPR